MLFIYFDVSDISLKDSWNIDFRELVFWENYHEACFPTCTIANNHQLLSCNCHISVTKYVTSSTMLLWFIWEYWAKITLYCPFYFKDWFIYFHEKDLHRAVFLLYTLMFCINICPELRLNSMGNVNNPNSIHISPFYPCRILGHKCNQHSKKYV